MSQLSKFFAWLMIDPRQTDLAAAQLIELQRQVPLLYLLLTVNAVAVAYTHRGVAPWSLTVAVPCVLVGICVLRTLVWLLRRHQKTDPSEAVTKLRRTVRLGGIIAVAYITWSLLLNEYGGPYEQGHVAIFIAITVIGCIFCLMHLPQAAVTITLLVTIPYVVYYIHLGNTVFYAVALNILLVTVVMLQVLLNSFYGFTRLIQSQGALAQKQAETERLAEENARLAHTDMLTGLPNRRYFFNRLDQMIETSAASGEVFTVGTIDLDRFKPVNDTYGHLVGDRLLDQVGLRLGSFASSEIVVTRLGGDEFGFLIARPGPEAQRMSQEICDRLSEPYQVGAITLSIGCSCGLASYPEAGDTAHMLFDRSDYALYSSKTARMGKATLYSVDHENKIRSGQAIETALRAADFDAEFSVVFQPIVAGRSNMVFAVEALARWDHPELGRVAPDQFIPVAERTGLVHPLTLALFRKALREMEKLPPGIKLSFNLSANDVTSTSTILSLVNAIGEGRIDARRIIFELTETAVIRNFETAVESINLLRRLGSQVALDDFGTGQSSLGYLHRLPIDEVKIDRSFVAGLENLSGRKIVASIQGLCRTLDIECIIEGVENGEQLRVLSALGCEAYQGYFFSRPLPMDELVDWIAARMMDAPRVASPWR
ncbi:putative bifunctional diguanylate cyclase/phosphodiesterase [Rhizobium sp. YIM 134829]|uniref:putative bifunctional diguanylate cyclase/phosphodiesterase n=1 Tax=Rhizobium sp. YIM 134829 TaxID=3390453 RepID=UPI00397A7DD4